MSILPPQKGLEIPGGRGGEGSQRPPSLSICMKLDWNFQRGGGIYGKILFMGEAREVGGSKEKSFHGGGMDNFWNHTVQEKRGLC